ncbi:amidase domain-containing protein [Thermosphaera sp.]
MEQLLKYVMNREGKMKRFIIFIFWIYSLNAFYYNRNAAVNYALQWCETFNPSYKVPEIERRDCANFVSQCLRAGGLNLFDPCNPEGRGLHERLKTYTSVAALKNFLECIAEEDDDPSCIRIGDIVIFYLPDGTPYHSAIVTQVNPIRISYHSENRCNVPIWSGAKFYRVLDSYEFYSEYIGGYYFRIAGGTWQGPVQTQGVAAVGYKPSSLQEFAGFNSFAVSGLPTNSQIERAYLKLVLNGTGGTSGLLWFNIKHTGYVSPPSVYSIINPPYHLTDQVFPYIFPNSYRYSPLPYTLYDNIMYAHNNSVPFVLGYSRCPQCSSMRYFWDYIGAPDVDATLLAFVDQCPSQESAITTMEKEYKEEDVSSLMKIQLGLKADMMKISYELIIDTYLDIFILSVDGRKIKSIFSGYKLSGKYEIFWDLKDEQGKEIPEGVYFLVFKIGNWIKSEKFIIYRYQK